jgi:hypothetical protein
MIKDPILEWLLEGDVSIQYQVHRDLLHEEKPQLRERIAREGWGAEYLSFRRADGIWGSDFYFPKWTSTHYTLLDLRNLWVSKNNREIKISIEKVLNENIAGDGGIRLSGNPLLSDVCVNGMFLNYASYFGADETKLKSVIDCILSLQLKDGGFNCQLSRKGAIHSSLHSTLSVAEGILEYSKNGYSYRLGELKKAEEESRQFMLEHKLFQSHRTGEIIDKKMLMLSYPYRWRYDILRALDYLHFAGVGFDPRMTDALDIIIGKRKSDDKWPLQSKYAGQTHFDMERGGQASRWNTLRALRVLNHFKYPESTF